MSPAYDQKWNAFVELLKEYVSAGKLNGCSGPYGFSITFDEEGPHIECVREKKDIIRRWMR